MYKIDPTMVGNENLQCLIYVKAEDDKGNEKVVTLSSLTRESLLDYVRNEGAEKIILHTFGHY